MAEPQVGDLTINESDDRVRLLYKQMNDPLMLDLNTRNGDQAAAMGNMDTTIGNQTLEPRNKVDLGTQRVQYQPRPFRGLSTELPDVFIRQYNKFANYNRFDDDRKLHGIGIFLEDTAAIWYDSIFGTVDEPANFPQFCDIFKQRFTSTCQARLENHRNFISRVQLVNENVDDFASSLRSLATKANKTQEALKTQFLGGLKPELKIHCVTHDPEDFDSAVNIALLCQSAIDSNTAMLSQQPLPQPEVPQMTSPITDNLNMDIQLLKNEVATLFTCNHRWNFSKAN